MNPSTASETKAILTLRLIASFADGDKHGRERQQLKKITDSLAGGKADGHLPPIVKAIKPAVAKAQGQPADAVREHVRAVVAQITKAGPVLADRVQAGQLKVVGARYDLDTGRVQFSK